MKHTVGHYQGLLVENVDRGKHKRLVVGASEDYDLACIWVQPTLPLDTFQERVLRIGDSDGLRGLGTVYVLGVWDESLPAENAVDEIAVRYMTLRET